MAGTHAVSLYHISASRAPYSTAMRGLLLLATMICAGERLMETMAVMAMATRVPIRVTREGRSGFWGAGSDDFANDDFFPDLGNLILDDMGDNRTRATAGSDDFANDDFFPDLGNLIVDDMGDNVNAGGAAPAAPQLAHSASKRKMSDIKYIIASEGDNGEHTRFPCLAVVRCAAATGVTVLALAVIAMVIHAVLRSEDIRLSVNDGYIGADNLRSQTYVPKTKTTTGVGVGKLAETQRRVYSSGDGISTDIIDRQPQSSVVSDRDANIGAGLGIGGYGYGDDDFPATPRVGTNYGSNGATRVVYQRANTTNLRVILIANNPGGRTKIDCNDTTVSVIDMQSPTSSYEIGTLKLDNFTVPPQTTITLQKRLKITDPAKLSYIWDNYGEEDSFSVVVRVSASVTSYPLGKKTHTEPRTYVCRMVTLGLIDHETYLATDDAECRDETSQTLASAPAPPPVPTR
ncbi:hypothetical protein TRIUR3_01209 [Triticum urartu]|uniref:Uncharacterized protein n=2 Tax=Triticum urartu TaxID=4572 RepID=M8AEB1_TRIUA|nr:hypothetical protein TRIUR3_01209 [Triticum urartu]